MPAQSDTGNPGRSRAVALPMGVGGSLPWAATALLDKTFPASGMFAPETGATVHFLNGGTIEQVLVREATK